MSCSCIKGTNWNFDIEVLDVKTLRYTDYTQWNTNHPYVVPETQQVILTIPEFNKKVTLEIVPNSSTIITAESLGISACLPDGVYCFEAYSCYNCREGVWGEKKFTKQDVVLPQTKCKVDNLIATASGFVEKKAFQFNGQLHQIEAVSRVGQAKKAADLYEILQTELDNYNCDTCC